MIFFKGATKTNYGVAIGTCNPKGYYKIFLPVPDDFNDNPNGAHKNLTIGRTRKGKLCIKYVAGYLATSRTRNEDIYMVLSVNNSHIQTLKRNSPKIIACDYDARGTAAAILHVHIGDIIRIVANNKTDSDPIFYTVLENENGEIEVYCIKQQKIEYFFARYYYNKDPRKNISRPFELIYPGKNENYDVNEDEWMTITEA